MHFEYQNRTTRDRIRMVLFRCSKSTISYTIYIVQQDEPHGSYMYPEKNLL